MAIWIASAAGCASTRGSMGGEVPPEKLAPDVHVLRPQKVSFEPAHLQRLTLPDGYTVVVRAQNLGKARMMALAPDGMVLVTRPDPGDVLAVPRDGGDPLTIISGLEGVHGIAVQGDRLLLATNTHVFDLTLGAGGEVGEPEVLYEGLPDGGQHPNRTLRFSPGGDLFLSVGSSCNACDEPNPEHATILRLRADGSGRTIYARGLRNTIGFDFHPETGELWGMDHGSDWRGDGIPPEELNRLVEGADYGWPYAYGDKQIDPVSSEPPGTTRAEYVARTTGSVLGYTAHAAPIGMVFYDGEQFPPQVRGDAFVAMHGSWNRASAVGYEVVRIDFDGGRPIGFHPFLTGFLLDESRHFGRPAGVLVDRDGGLLVTDDDNGIMYAVTYDGGRS